MILSVKRILLGSLLLLCIFILPISAADADYRSTTMQSDGFEDESLLNDENERTYTKTPDGGTVTLSRENGIASLYVVFDRIPAPWTISDGTTSFSCGENAFLHEYVDVIDLFGYTPLSLTLTFPAKASISEIYGFSEGVLPSWVQIWQPPCTEADILLISSHSDDEQLFFAGLLPLYAGERGLDVQVVYLVHHFDVHNRPHEQLDGLWTVGVRNYPVISDFPDLYSESLEGAKAVYRAQGITYENFCGFITECIRRFRPQVLVTHDINGEYGHGTHLLCTAALRDCLESTADPMFYPDSAYVYGVWDVPKTYLHLYTENAIVLNYDIPLETFGGKTAFEVSQDGFRHHKSQHWTWFYNWIYGTSDKPITRAAQINYCSPCRYGLYRSTVGADVLGGDFFENLVPYAVLNAAQEPPETTPSETMESAAESETMESAAESETTGPDIGTTDTTSAVEPTDTDLTTPPSPETTDTQSDTDKPSKPSTLLLAVIGVIGIACIMTFSLVLGYILCHPRKRRRR